MYCTNPFKSMTHSPTKKKSFVQLLCPGHGRTCNILSPRFLFRYYSLLTFGPLFVPSLSTLTRRVCFLALSSASLWIILPS